MIARSRGLLALLAVCLLSLPTPALAAPAAATSSGTSLCFGSSFLYESFTNRSRVVQISIVFVAAGYFFLKGTIRR